MTLYGNGTVITAAALILQRDICSRTCDLFLISTTDGLDTTTYPDHAFLLIEIIAKHDRDISELRARNI